MRKKFLFLAVGMMMLLFGCGVKNNAVASSLNKGAFLAETSQASLTATSQAESSLSETSQAESSLSETSQAASVQDDSSVSAQASGDVVDLTKLNGTMMYSQVFDMMSNPQKYMGKRVVMRGQFSFYQPMDGDGKPIPDRIYCSCVIADATACCSQGLEFDLSNKPASLEDYPAAGDDIEVSGTFSTYDEGGFTYCRLINAAMKTLDEKK